MAAEVSGAAVLILLSSGSCSCLLVLITTAVLLFLACPLCYKKIQVFVSLGMVNLSSGRKRENECKTTLLPREVYSSYSAAVKCQFNEAFKHTLKSIPAKQNA